MNQQVSEPAVETNNPVIAGITIEDIGTLPEVVAQINELAERADVTAEDVAKPIERDPTLTSKVLRILNSAYYGLRRDITSLPHAVAYLGIHQIRNIVISSAVIESFQFKHGVVDPRGMWEHSLGCAIGAKRMGDIIPGLDGDSSYLGGLLHDLGRIVFLSKLSDEYSGVVDACERGLCSMREAEESQFGISHAEAGYVLGEAWGFSDVVLATIRHHHNPAAAGELAPQAATVAFANAICHINGLRFGFGVDDESAEEEREQAWDVLLTSLPPSVCLQRDLLEGVIVECIEHTRSLVSQMF